MLQNHIDSIKQNFSEYLINLGLSPKSHKNYKSDLSHFSGWIILKVRSFGSYIESLTEAVPFLSKEIAAEYKNFMIENAIPVKTINRRLSTLRHLSKFLLFSQNLDHNFMEGIENISQTVKRKLSQGPIIDDFRGYLEGQKVSGSTIKNYVSDVGQFLTWLETNQRILNSKS